MNHLRLVWKHCYCKVGNFIPSEANRYYWFYFFNAIFLTLMKLVGIVSRTTGTYLRVVFVLYYSIAVWDKYLNILSTPKFFFFFIFFFFFFLWAHLNSSIHITLVNCTQMCPWDKHHIRPYLKRKSRLLVFHICLRKNKFASISKI